MSTFKRRLNTVLPDIKRTRRVSSREARKLSLKPVEVAGFEGANILVTLRRDSGKPRVAHPDTKQIRSLLKGIADESAILAQLRENPQQLQTRFDLSEAELDALRAADAFMVATRGNPFLEVVNEGDSRMTLGTITIIGSPGPNDISTTCTVTNFTILILTDLADLFTPDQIHQRRYLRGMPDSFRKIPVDGWLPSCSGRPPGQCAER